MGLFTGKRLTEYREDSIRRDRERLERLEKHGQGDTDAARAARSDIRFQEKQLAAEARDRAGAV